MSVAALVHPVAVKVAVAVSDVVVWAEDKTPKDEDVKAGWTAFVIFLLLIGAVVVLGFSLVKQLRKAQAAKDAGVYGPDDENHDTTRAPRTEPENHTAP